MAEIIQPLMPNMTMVHLLSVPLENDYKHTLFFESEIEQHGYFLTKIVTTGENFTFQRKDNVIRWGSHIDNLRNANYVMYRNSGYSDKWFYAFITKMEYMNDGRTDIYIETDVLQTWLFDYDVKSSFVEREHVINDTFGLHTYPEGLETGEYIVNNHKVDTMLKDLALVIGITAEPNGAKVGGKNYNGIYSGVKYKCCKYENASLMTDFINSYDEAGRGTAIQCLFILPVRLVSSSMNLSSTELTDVYNNDLPASWILTHTRNKTLNGYTPRNNKLLCYPYNCMILSNNNGGSATYRFEEFSSDLITFNVSGSVAPSGSVRAVPTGYKGANVNDDEGLNLGKFPICNWQSDVYINWLTQNSVNHTVSMGSAIANTSMGALGSLASLNVGGAVNSVINGATSIGSIIGEKYAHSLQPPQVNGNINCGDVITSDGKNNFHIYDMSIKREYAQIIDEYFDCYGYKVCRVKVPNKNHRRAYWFTKTIDVNIDPKDETKGIPMNDMLKIKTCYNSGITFWRSDYVGDYSAENPIEIRG